MEYEVVIGLEIHAQLLTDSKIFCGCSTKFGNPPNTNICPVCTGQPGVLPVLNKKVVDFAVKTALALDCKKVEGISIFARKNYFYPDLPKNYQVSQYEKPLAEHGHLEIEVKGKKKKIGITRVHLEEDAGKLVHKGAAGLRGADYSNVDLNRAGVPLMEIVSEPDIRTSEEAKVYVEELRNILVYLGVCNGNMEEGSLRCDANISLRPVGSKEFGTKTEVKNMNSFRFIQNALEAEIKRQKEILEEGGKITQETRLYNDETGETFSMRSKEEAHDYRYFPEPDLVPLELDKKWIEDIKKTIGELPGKKKEKYIKELGLPEHDATVILGDKDLAAFFEEGVKLGGKPKLLSNWVIGDLSAYLNEKKISITKANITPEQLIEMIKLIDKGTISGKMAKDILVKVLETGKSVSDVVSGSGMTQISDEGELVKAIQRALKDNPKPVADYKGGKHGVIGFLVGQVMKATKGRANPGVVNKLLKKELEK
ncbi:Asp-tRNA(Asn)/Glu-tRNA(Gln) amidotransferase subunit GatB [Candidatus Margulisiibacteriota bacterium]